jgi:hypothetical protein
MRVTAVTPITSKARQTTMMKYGLRIENRGMGPYACQIRVMCVITNVGRRPAPRWRLRRSSRCVPAGGGAG